MQARFLRLSERISQARLEAVGEPHVKHLQGKLWELRLTGRDGIARVLYVTAIGRRVVVVRAFVKKTRKTPRAEIEIALRRARNIECPSSPKTARPACSPTRRSRPSMMHLHRSSKLPPSCSGPACAQ